MKAIYAVAVILTLAWFKMVPRHTCAYTTGRTLEEKEYVHGLYHYLPPLNQRVVRDASLNTTDATNTTHNTVPRCMQPMDPGMCRAKVPRWYYNHAEGTCMNFTYGGCQGNSNNFPTIKHCEAACPDEIECPFFSVVCLVSESICVNATCPSHPEAVCFVLPCSCHTYFILDGERVDCDESVPTTTDTTDAITTIATPTTTNDTSTTNVTIITVPVVGNVESEALMKVVRGLMVLLVVALLVTIMIFFCTSLLPRCQRCKKPTTTRNAMQTGNTDTAHEVPPRSDNDNEDRVESPLVVESPLL